MDEEVRKVAEDGNEVRRGTEAGVRERNRQEKKLNNSKIFRDACDGRNAFQLDPGASPVARDRRFAEPIFLPALT